MLSTSSSYLESRGVSIRTKALVKWVVRSMKALFSILMISSIFIKPGLKRGIILDMS